MNLKTLCVAAQLLLVGSFITHAQHAPPPAPPPIENAAAPIAAAAPDKAAAGGPVRFSVGDPTDEEQLYLELINRARVDASAEAERMIAHDDIFIKTALQKVNLTMMRHDFGTNPPASPLSFNAKLITAARNHSQYMLTIADQTHDGPGPGETLANRLQKVSYPVRFAGENVFANAESVEQGHAGFEVDWSTLDAFGKPPDPNGGMQNPPGHRNNIHANRFVEVGIGVVFGRNQIPPDDPVGPQLVTQDFGAQNPLLNYVTGVAYYDLNGNNFYDLGEGLGGITVRVDGDNDFAITSRSGAYSVPVASGATHTVRFDGPGFAQTVVSATLPAGLNAKVDFKRTYTPPAVTSGPSIAFTGIPSTYKFSPVGGATAYRARVFTSQAPPPLEGAEGPLNVTLTTFGNYQPISTAVKATGAKSFHLLHLVDPAIEQPRPQLIEFPNQFLVKTGAKIDFKSRLGIASGGNGPSNPGEMSRVEVSTDDGANWTTIWMQPGTVINTDNSEKVFTQKSVNLADYTDRLIRIRFNFDLNPTVGWVDFEGSDTAFGWYLDDIVLSSVDQAANAQSVTLDASAKFTFNPAATGDYVMQFAGVAGTREFPWGPVRAVSVQSNPPIYTFLKTPVIAEGKITLRAVKTADTTTTPVILESASDPAGPWSQETAATITGLIRNEYVINVPLNGNIRFYRVQSN